MASPMVVKVGCMALIMSMVLSLSLPLTQAAITCGQVTSTLAPCIPYLRSPRGPVPGPCCGGVRTLNNQAKTTPDRQAVCRCIKTASQSIPGINLPAVTGLPGKCGVNLPYKITPTLDCSKVR